MRRASVEPQNSPQITKKKTLSFTTLRIVQEKDSIDALTRIEWPSLAPPFLTLEKLKAFKFLVFLL